MVWDGGAWTHDDSTYYVEVECITAVHYMNGRDPSAANNLPNGIAIDDSTTPIFSISYGIYYTEDGELFLFAFYGIGLASELSAGNNWTDCTVRLSGFDGTVGYGGTATISWE